MQHVGIVQHGLARTAWILDIYPPSASCNLPTLPAAIYPPPASCNLPTLPAAICSRYTLWSPTRGKDKSRKKGKNKAIELFVLILLGRKLSFSLTSIQPFLLKHCFNYIYNSPSLIFIRPPCLKSGLGETLITV